MISNLMRSLLFTLILMNVTYAGGSSIVGDGGYGVICHKKTYFYDRFEYLVTNDWKESEPVGRKYIFRKEMARTAMKIGQDYGLSQYEATNLIIAAKDISELYYYNRRPYSGVGSLGEVVLFLKTKKINPSEKALEYIKANNCELFSLATLISRKEAETIRIEDACIAINRQYCLVVDRLRFKDLDIKNQRCLVTHELLRMVPKSYQNEEELRFLTMKYCF